MNNGSRESMTGNYLLTGCVLKVKVQSNEGNIAISLKSKSRVSDEGKEREKKGVKRPRKAKLSSNAQIIPIGIDKSNSPAHPGTHVPTPQ